MIYKNIGKGSAVNADCFEVMAQMEDGCVDMILADLPYGTTACKWDSVIPFEKLWPEFNRICKPNASIVLTASQPFTSALVMSNPKAFKYEWIWEKGKASGHLNAKKRPLLAHESVCVFSKGNMANGSKSPMNYFPQGLTEKMQNSARPAKNNHRKGEEVYNKGNGNYGISEKSNYPRSVQKFSGEHSPIHPTQKPVALFEYLIKTYTNENDLVFDPTAGSLTTGVAAENLGRRWVCCETDAGYFEKGIARF